MANKPDIIVFSLFRLDSPYTAISVQLAKVWARESRVFYINHPYSHKDLIQMRKDPVLKGKKTQLLSGKTIYEPQEGFGDNFISITPRLTYPINWMSQGGLYNRAWKHNNQILLDTITEIKKKYKVGEYIFFNSLDPYYLGSLPKEMGAQLSVYGCFDDISFDPYTVKHGVRLELDAMKTADVTLCTSVNLLDKFKDHAEHCYLLNNAVDTPTIERIRDTQMPRPAEWEHAKGRIIGYIGNLDHIRIDYQLLKKIALAYPNDTLALIGPINCDLFYEADLDKLPNVIASGSRPYKDLPPYLQHMDVTIIPFLFNKVTASIYPLKINEYLAAGKPVVSTRFSRDIEGFNDHIYLSNGDQSFIELIERAFDENTPELAKKRVEVALDNTWEARVIEFWRIVEIIKNKKANLSFEKA
jgi:teichuronic acid biosynthesis glycosyltransferase TuaH